jgi:signal peptidase I, archaeal type
MPASPTFPSVGRGSQWAFSLAVSLLVVVAAAVAVGPRLFPYRVVFVRSASMAPALATGSLALLTPVAAGRVEPGEIITFPRPTPAGGLITHRVVAIRDGPGGRHLVTKGDTSAATDPWLVPARGTAWRLRLSVPYLGFAVGFLGSPLAWLAAAVALAGAAGWRRPRPPQAAPGGRARTHRVVPTGLAALALFGGLSLGPGAHTSASFTAQAQNSSSEFSTAALGAPSGLTGAASGHDVVLSWTAGTNGSGYLVEGVGNGTSTDCSTVTFASVGTTSGTGYTDAGRYSPQGTWFWLPGHDHLRPPGPA